ncbi:hypothetical protein [Flavobacterium suncheonense]|uniref:hypothetical protein n=1 Tax=Flavobacterium suncheonense TaxID=350894 RepID=UPI00040AAF68|nr:hypothetical protein [Flavobacterium suncheonense]
MQKLLLLLFYCHLTAQVGIGTNVPNSDAMLDVVNPSKGVLLPRVSLQSTISSSPMSNHVEGMMVYNTSENGSGISRVFPGLYYNDGNNWIRFNPNTVKIGELKHSFATSDHNGWYLMNGRNTNTLSANAQANATALGFSSNLPDMADIFLKAKSGSEVLGSVGGNQSFSIAQNNLPNVNFSGSTNGSGIHNHNVDSYLGNENIGLLSTTALTLFITESVAKENATTASRTTQSEGNHTHTVSFNSGGTDTPVDNVPKYMATNIFIYLGY